jgi:hypothetical protein
MKRERFTDEQIVWIWRVTEQDSVAEVIKGYGVSQTTIYVT